NSITSIRNSISQWEYAFWSTYRNRRGSLNFGLRLDESLAEIKLMFRQMNGESDVDIWDYLPYHDAPDLSFDAAYAKYNED
ncbi:hypothetical protein, partial [Acinetobacter johnsonii]